jgi:hypothetical protein
MALDQDILCIISCTLFIVEAYQPNVNIWVGGVAASYFVIDMLCFIKDTDMFFHHACALWLAFNVVYDPYPPEVLRTIANVEWSTLVLTMNNYLTGTWLTCSQVLFVIVFIKVRLIALFPLLFSRLTYLQWFPLVPLYGLNVYWFFKICKRIVKMISPKSE